VAYKSGGDEAIFEILISEITSLPLADRNDNFTFERASIKAIIKKLR
jgi:hypothetical protein